MEQKEKREKRKSAVFQSKIMRKFLSIFFIVTGILLIGFAIYSKITTTYYQNKLFKEYNLYMDSLKEKPADITGNIIESENTAKGEVEFPQKEENEISIEVEDAENSQVEDSGAKFDLEKFLKDKEISGLIEIPSLKVTAAILEGTDDSALKYTVGHYPGFGEIGKGNYVLLGHRNYLYGHFFRNIDKLEAGDLINIKKDTETYSYSVTESFVVSPDEVWVLEQTSEPTLTLITCTPMGTYTDRLIVKGVLND